MVTGYLDGISVAGVLAGAFALWCARVISRRLGVDQASRQPVETGGAWAKPLPRLGYAALCIMLAGLIAAVQIALVHDLLGAVAIGVAFSVVPTAYFVGRDASNPWPRDSIRALSIFIGLVVCAVLVRVVRF